MTEWKKTFACSFIAQVFSIVGFSFALPFLPFFIEELGIADRSQQTWWAGVTLAATGVTLAIFAPIWGLLADKYGRKSMVIRSMIGGTLVLILMSFSRNIGDLFVCRLIQGAFTGTVSASLALVASVTPPKRSGFALGMMQAAVLVGNAIGPLVGGVVADQFGYRAAFRIGSVLVFLGSVLVYFGTNESFAPTDKNSEGVTTFRDLLKNNAFMFAIMILTVVRFANTIINPSFPLVIKDILTNPARLNSATGIVMACAGLAGAISAGWLGHVGDRLGHQRILIFCTLATGFTATAHAFARSMPELALIHMCFGISIAGVLPAVNTIIQRTTDQRNMGKAFGVSSSISMIGLALGPLTGGFLGSTFGIRSPFLAAGLCQMIVAYIAFMHFTRKKPVAS